MKEVEKQRQQERKKRRGIMKRKKQSGEFDSQQRNLHLLIAKDESRKVNLNIYGQTIKATREM